MSKEDEFMQVAEAAEFLGVSANTIRNWGRDAKLQEYRHPLNNYRLYKKADLARLAKRLQHPKPVKGGTRAAD